MEVMRKYRVSGNYNKMENLHFFFKSDTLARYFSKPLHSEFEKTSDTCNVKSLDFSK